MIIEFERELKDFIQEEKTWDEVCTQIKQPMSIIAVALKKLKDIGEILEIVKDNNIYYKINDNQREDSESIA
jgi:hypothetical protein